MPKYMLRVSGEGSEVCWQSLTKAQSDYWLQQDEDRLHSYIFCSEEERYGDEFEDVPTKAHIKGSQDKLDDLFHGFGPSEGECVLFKVSGKAKETEIWRCDLSELAGEDEEPVDANTPAKKKTKCEHALVSENNEEGCFIYEWDDVTKDVKPSDFTTIWSPDLEIVYRILLLGKVPNRVSEDTNCGNSEVRIEKA